MSHADELKDASRHRLEPDSPRDWETCRNCVRYKNDCPHASDDPGGGCEDVAEFEEPEPFVAGGGETV